MSFVPTNSTVVCWNCDAISEAHGEICPHCNSRGTLENLKRKLYEMSFFSKLEKELKQS